MKKFRRTFLLALISVFCVTAAAQAVTDASAQIASYAINSGSISDGEIFIDFSITGAGNMKKIGAEQIDIYDLNSSIVFPVKTFSEDDDGMSVYNDYICNGSIYYQGIIGHTYRVVVTVFAEDYNGDSDSRTKTFTFTAD